ncbi:MAG: polysaccharide biosynthesis/export family protein, partial [Asticcacaulis sp.]
MTTRRHFLGAAVIGASVAGLGLAAAAGARPFGFLSGKDKMPEAPEIAFATWSDEEPLYLFYPGDKLEIDVSGAPELSRQTQVGPDGRVTLPLIGGVMAAYRSVPQLQAEISQRYQSVLRNPEVSVLPGDTAPLQIMVGGEVKTPGWIPMGGDMDALQAVMAAGGPLHSAKLHNVMIIRRSRDGQAMRRIVDLQDPLS